VTVESADETLEQAQRCGGGISGPAFDVFDSGRMGIIQDPQGAHVMVWQPKNHIGAGLVNAPGALSWNELATPDIEASTTFYCRVFGWKTEPFDAMGMPYMTIATDDGHTNGGVRQAAASEPCYWLAYFGSENVEATLADVKRHDGEVLMGPMDIGVGQLAAVQDPQGAVFALYGGHFDD
jgi:predicted enzyme related to lactoylglutathione lyase